MRTRSARTYAHDAPRGPEPAGHLYAATDQGVFRSSDEGQSWSATALDRLRTPVLVLDPSRPSALYAANRRGLYLSLDGAGTWSRLDTSAIDAPAEQVFVASAPSKPDLLYSVTPRDGLYSSPDGGLHWNSIGAGLPEFLSYAFLAVDPTLPETLYLLSVEARLKSQDSGQTWSPMGSDGSLPSGIWEFAVDPRRPETLYASGYGSIHKSEDGGSHWRRAGGDFVASSPIALAVDTRTEGLLLPLLYVGSSEGVLMWPLDL